MYKQAIREPLNQLHSTVMRAAFVLLRQETLQSLVDGFGGYVAVRVCVIVAPACGDLHFTVNFHTEYIDLQFHLSENLNHRM